jgi:hypothetical protein
MRFPTCSPLGESQGATFSFLASRDAALLLLAIFNNGVLCQL